MGPDVNTRSSRVKEVTRTPRVPLMIDFRGKGVLIVGGGAVGLRKAKVFLKAGADVTVLAKEFAAGFERLKVTRVRAGTAAVSKMLSRAFFVVAATNDRVLNYRIAHACERRGIPCNIVDDPRSGVYMTSTVIQGPITIGISTNGASPALARKARTEIGRLIGPEWSAMAALQAEARDALRGARGSQASRREILLRMVDDDEVWALLRARDLEGARRFARQKYLVK
jgi:siroheme synthase-like protein